MEAINHNGGHGAYQIGVLLHDKRAAEGVIFDATDIEQGPLVLEVINHGGSLHRMLAATAGDLLKQLPVDSESRVVFKWLDGDGS